MQRFSEVFGIGLDQSQLDFVDVSPDIDTPLFIDPFAISMKNDAWSENCHRHITHFFQTALDCIRAGEGPKARALLNGLSEPNETCLGLSRGKPAGRGVSGKQALDLYDSLSSSQAADSGILAELAECDLFVEGIGKDKISDITTNIIRRLLIEYTQSQCALHGIALTGEYPSGRYWDIDSQSWKSSYEQQPVIDGKRIILVPKYSVRRSLSLEAQEYYSHHILNFIQEEEFNRGSPLVRTLQNGERRPPTKKSLREKFPFSKDFVARFSESHPDVLERYKQLYSTIEGARGALQHTDFDEDLDETVLATALIERLVSIPPGQEAANEFHSYMVGALEFIFWPNLIYPIKETPIHEGRKRIDVTYTNAANSGFFHRTHSAHEIASNMVMVECKNYSKDPANPELDQLSGRFSINRGKLGLLVYRTVSDYERLLMRCRDTAADGRGFILPLGEEQVTEFLALIASRERSSIDGRLQDLLQVLIT
ncbi:MAG: hypothetical protein HOK98_16735 [Rhodospirillaceae bacterium]|nr:hypothetical protein [Rhodospirillaceae bacterium]